MVNYNNVREHKLTKAHEFFTRRLKPLAGIFAALRIDPNWFTALSVLFAIGAAFFLGYGQWLLAICSIILIGLCDMTDGELARAMPNRRTALKNWGELLDPTTDRISDAFLFLGLLGYSLMHQLPGWFCVLVAGSMAAHTISSYIRTKVESMNRRFQKDKPLTRATFHACLLAVCAFELLVPLIVDVDLERIIFLRFYFEELVFFIGVLLLVCMPTIYTCLRRFYHSYTIFSKDS